jgi:hypothetical protein
MISRQSGRIEIPWQPGYGLSMNVLLYPPLSSTTKKFRKDPKIILDKYF